MIKEKAKESKLIGHSLEEGLSNEEVIRSVLGQVLPKRYGIGKGKVANALGTLSKHCDIIIYDSLNCPNLYLDNHMNQVLPIEGVYAIIEVKTQLTKSKIKESFDNAESVKNLLKSPVNVSTNDLIQIIPPLYHVVAFEDRRTLETIYDNYVAFNKEYARTQSSLSFSKKSPGYAEHTGQQFLVEDIVIVDKGAVFYMYHGVPCIIQSAADALGIFMVNLFGHLQEMKLRSSSLHRYYGETCVEYDQKTKTEDGFLVIKPGSKPRSIEQLRELERKIKEFLKRTRGDQSNARANKRMA